MRETTVHLHRPATMDVRLIRACPTCKRRRRFAGFDTPPWYGVTLTCCACGDTWSDGERLERPFARGWRVKSAAKAKATWVSAVRYGSPEHREFVRAQFADSFPERGRAVPDIAKWVRVRLTSPATDAPSLTEGEIVLRADSMLTDGEHWVFLLGAVEVFRLDRKYHQTHAWFVDRPTFAEWLRARRAQYAMQHRPWSADETFRLRQEVADGVTWERIAVLHERTIGAVKAKAAQAKEETR